MRQAAQKLQTHKLQGFSLYSSAEPCLMCMGAAIWFRIERIYFGVDIKELANLGFEQITIPDKKIAQHSPWSIKVYPHILHEKVLRFYQNYQNNH